MCSIKSNNLQSLASLVPEYYTNGRAKGTIKQYSIYYKQFREFAVCNEFHPIGVEPFIVACYLIQLDIAGTSEAVISQSLAAINLVHEVWGLSSPSKDPVVIQVKHAIIKSLNRVKVKKNRQPFTIDIVAKFIAKFFKPNEFVKPVERRLLMIILILFFGVKRFDDIIRTQLKHLVWEKDGSVTIQVPFSKTDPLGQGNEFTLSHDDSEVFSVVTILKWYVKSFKFSAESFIFPPFAFCKSNQDGLQPVGSKPISYSSIRAQLKEESKKIGLDYDLDLHGGRIGGATTASGLQVDRDIIKQSGFWKSSAVDSYIRKLNPNKHLSKVLSSEMSRKLKK